MTAETLTYEQRAQQIARAMGLTIAVAFKGDRCPPWANGQELHNACPKCYTIHGDRYRVTLRLPTPFGFLRSLSFDYWGSLADRESGRRPGYYDILTRVDGDATSPTDPDEVYREYGAITPSRAVAIAKHSARLQAFFTSAELTRLAEVDQ